MPDVEVAVVGAGLVVTADPPTAAALIPTVGPAPKPRRTTTYYYATPTSPTDGSGLLALNGNGAGPVGNVLVLTDRAPSYGPRPLVQASTLQPDVPETVIRHQLADRFGRQADDWEHLRTVDVPYALPAAEPPQHRLRHPVRIEPGLYVCGDWRGSPSIQGAMVSGRRAAEALVRDQNRSRSAA